MGIVEQRINELLQVYAYMQQKKGKPLYSNDMQDDEEEDKQAKSGNVSDMVASLQDQFHGIEKGDMEDDSDDDADQFSVPMNSEAFMAKIS